MNRPRKSSPVRPASRRNDIHVYLVGDVNSGKSALLWAIGNLMNLRLDGVDFQGIRPSFADYWRHLDQVRQVAWHRTGSSALDGALELYTATCRGADIVLKTRDVTGEVQRALDHLNDPEAAGDAAPLVRESFRRADAVIVVIGADVLLDPEVRRLTAPLLRQRLTDLRKLDPNRPLAVVLTKMDMLPAAAAPLFHELLGRVRNNDPDAEQFRLATYEARGAEVEDLVRDLLGSMDDLTRVRFLGASAWGSAPTPNPKGEGLRIPNPTPVAAAEAFTWVVREVVGERRRKAIRRNLLVVRVAAALLLAGIFVFLHWSISPLRDARAALAAGAGEFPDRLMETNWAAELIAGRATVEELRFGAALASVRAGDLKTAERRIDALERHHGPGPLVLRARSELALATADSPGALLAVKEDERLAPDARMLAAARLVSMLTSSLATSESVRVEARALLGEPQHLTSADDRAIRAALVEHDAALIEQALSAPDPEVAPIAKVAGDLWSVLPRSRRPELADRIVFVRIKLLPSPRPAHAPTADAAIRVFIPLLDDGLPAEVRQRAAERSFDFAETIRSPSLVEWTAERMKTTAEAAAQHRQRIESLRREAAALHLARARAAAQELPPAAAPFHWRRFLDELPAEFPELRKDGEQALLEAELSALRGLLSGSISERSAHEVVSQIVEDGMRSNEFSPEIVATLFQVLGDSRLPLEPALRLGIWQRLRGDDGTPPSPAMAAALAEIAKQAGRLDPSVDREKFGRVLDRMGDPAVARRTVPDLFVATGRVAGASLAVKPPRDAAPIVRDLLGRCGGAAPLLAAWLGPEGAGGAARALADEAASRLAKGDGSAAVEALRLANSLAPPTVVAAQPSLLAEARRLVAAAPADEAARRRILGMLEEVERAAFTEGALRPLGDELRTRMALAHLAAGRVGEAGKLVAELLDGSAKRALASHIARVKDAVFVAGDGDTPSFYIGVTETTAAEYDAFAERTSASLLPEHPILGRCESLARRVPAASRPWWTPATGVTFHQAWTYAAAAGGGLPTAMQWRLAWGARRYPWGEVFVPRATFTAEAARDRGSVFARPGEGDRTPAGVRNLHGNAMEFLDPQAPMGPLLEVPVAGSSILTEGESTGRETVTAMAWDESRHWVGFRVVYPAVPKGFAPEEGRKSR